MKILYICTHNRCRSILSEAITNQLADWAIEARSAGSQPVGEVHPLSLRYLKEKGYPTNDLTSQSWDDFEDFEPDVVITVCDSAAGESCPVYFGKSCKVHWGLADPSKVEGSEETISRAFDECIHEIENRVSKLVTIARHCNSRESLQAALCQAGAQA
ncbi:arsenate reductase ArsC [Alteromonas antoniana]|uniref:arsenate reductase ArsC n=1 Tax=Alteromonas antoniana TaxID=2803813 RepID=UPI001C4680D5|nr:arsenate reductase ArsC [Alteromonas antoniana]